MMSAACRSARAIRSRGLTFRSSSTSSGSGSRNGVRSSTPGSPPAFAARPALAALAVRRAWSAMRPATMSPRRSLGQLDVLANVPGRRHIRRSVSAVLSGSQGGNPPDVRHPEEHSAAFRPAARSRGLSFAPSLLMAVRSPCCLQQSGCAVIAVLGSLLTGEAAQPRDREHLVCCSRCLPCLASA